MLFQGRFSQAFEALDQAEREAHAGLAEDTVSNVFFWTGWMHAALGNLTAAHAALSKAQQLALRLGLSRRAVDARALLSLIDPASGADRQTLLERDMHRGFSPRALFWFGDSALRSGDTERAYVLLSAAEHAFEQLGLKIETWRCALALCEVDLQRGSLPAMVLLNRVVALRSHVRGIADLDSQALSLMSELFSEQRNPAKPSQCCVKPASERQKRAIRFLTRR